MWLCECFNMPSIDWYSHVLLSNLTNYILQPSIWIVTVFSKLTGIRIWLITWQSMYISAYADQWTNSVMLDLHWNSVIYIQPTLAWCGVQFYQLYIHLEWWQSQPSSDKLHHDVFTSLWIHDNVGHVVLLWHIVTTDVLPMVNWVIHLIKHINVVFSDTSPLEGQFFM
jgi:hypothetical protein